MKNIEKRIEKLFEKRKCVRCKKRLRSGSKYCSDCQYDIMLERQRNYYKFKLLKK